MNKRFVLRFSPDSLRRLADGTKRATVLPATQAARIAVDEAITAATAGAQAQLPMRIVELHQLRHLGALPSAAHKAGLTLADFTTLPDWRSYQRATTRWVHGAAILVVLEPTGPIDGPLPQHRHRKTPDSLHGRVWHRVTEELPIHSADQIHDRDRAELRTRVAAAVHAHRPDEATAIILSRVTDELLNSGRCGPAALGRPRRRRLGDQLEAALDWLIRHHALAGHGADRTWSRELLAGLRINQDDRPTAPDGDSQR